MLFKSPSAKEIPSGKTEDEINFIETLARLQDGKNKGGELYGNSNRKGRGGLNSNVRIICPKVGSEKNSKKGSSSGGPGEKRMV